MGSHKLTHAPEIDPGPTSKGLSDISGFTGLPQMEGQVQSHAILSSLKYCYPYFDNTFEHCLFFLFVKTTTFRIKVTTGSVASNLLDIIT